jgi:hypothetical protein
MRKINLSFLSLQLFFWSSLIAQSAPLKNLARIPGSSIKWVNVAEPTFRQKGLNLDDYLVVVDENRESVYVILMSIDAVKGSLGSSGSHPGFHVEISKKDMKVIGYSYDR